MALRLGPWTTNALCLLCFPSIGRQQRTCKSHLSMMRKLQQFHIYRISPKCTAIHAQALFVPETFHGMCHMRCASESKTEAACCFLTCLNWTAHGCSIEGNRGDLWEAS